MSRSDLRAPRPGPCVSESVNVCVLVCVCVYTSVFDIDPGFSQSDGPGGVIDWSSAE